MSGSEGMLGVRGKGSGRGEIDGWYWRARCNRVSILRQCKLSINVKVVRVGGESAEINIRPILAIAFRPGISNPELVLT